MTLGHAILGQLLTVLCLRFIIYERGTVRVVVKISTWRHSTCSGHWLAHCERSVNGSSLFFLLASYLFRSSNFTCLFSAIWWKRCFSFSLIKAHTAILIINGLLAKCQGSELKMITLELTWTPNPEASIRVLFRTQLWVDLKILWKSADLVSCGGKMQPVPEGRAASMGRQRPTS